MFSLSVCPGHKAKVLYYIKVCYFFNMNGPQQFFSQLSQVLRLSLQENKANFVTLKFPLTRLLVDSGVVGKMTVSNFN